MLRVLRAAMNGSNPYPRVSPVSTDTVSLPEADLSALATPAAHTGGLSARQVQILDMLRAGKVNKEIANELGIGLGTVKQHVVALFKKLNVRNRTMAVSRGTEHQPKGMAQLMDAALLEQRPCVVLSFVLSAAAAVNADRKFDRFLHQTMAANAYDYDAIFLARKDHAGDLIFGIPQAGENLIALALCAAHRIVDTLATLNAGMPVPLRGGLTAGLAVASMNRQGGWSGEAIASAAISQARTLAQESPPGQLALGPPVRELLRIFGPAPTAAIADKLDFVALDRPPWQTAAAMPGADTFSFSLPPLLGRESEQMQLEEFLRIAHHGGGRCVYLEGETGMGKSRLCHFAAHRGRDLGECVHYWVCQSKPGGQAIFALSDGAPAALPALLANLATPRPIQHPELWIFDDSHFLAQDDLLQIVQHARQTRDRLVLLAGRRVPEVAAHVDAVLHLGRLPTAVVQQIVALHPAGTHTPARLAELAHQASGVPLFAVELARHAASDALPLSLRLVIGARMDRLKIDRLLLRHVARAPALWSATQLSRSLRETRASVQKALDHAAACGVLAPDEQARYGFTHPLLRQAVIQAEVE